MLRLQYKKLQETAQVPSKKYPTDAAYDLYACIETEDNVITVPGGQVKSIPTGLSIDIPEGYELEIYSRSGLASKGIFVANQPGTIDSGYTGEIRILIYNSTSLPYNIRSLDRVAQMKARRVLPTSFCEVEAIKVKDRGDNGFGSTGMN